MSKKILIVLLILNLIMAVWVAYNWYWQDQSDQMETQIMFERASLCWRCN